VGAGCAWAGVSLASVIVAFLSRRAPRQEDRAVTSPSSNRSASLRAFALLTGIVAAPAACTLDLAGLPSGGGGSTSTSTSSSGGGTSASSSASTGTGGMMSGCVPGTPTACYDGPAGTEGVASCKGGMKTCKADGTGYGACIGQVQPSTEDCFTDGDEDCNGQAPKCTGATLAAGQLANLADEVVFAVATDTAGNLLLGGVQNSSVGGGVTVSKGTGAIAKLATSAGAPLAWSRTLTSFAPGSYSVVRGVATDKNNNVFLVGEFQGSIQDGDINLPSAGGVDIFLIKLDSSGKVLWQRVFGDGMNQSGNAIAVDASGNVFITGAMGGAFKFGTSTLTANGGQDIFVAKFNGAGVHQWSKNFGDSSPNQVGSGLAATPQGDVVVVGSVQGNIDFGNGNLPPAPGDDIFVARLAAGDGSGVWSKRYGDDKNQNAYGVAVGSDDSVVLTGTMFGKCNFGGVAGALDAGMSADAFVAKLHGDGSPDWSRNYGSSAEIQAGIGVAIDAQQNLAVVGFFRDTIKFASTTLTAAPSSNKQDFDVFVAKLAPDGLSGWARGFGDSKDQKAWAVAINPSSEVIVGGTFEGGIDFGSPLSQLNAVGYDGFWVKLAP
jgi:hypothetical protein